MEESSPVEDLTQNSSSLSSSHNKDESSEIDENLELGHIEVEKNQQKREEDNDDTIVKDKEKAEHKEEKEEQEGNEKNENENEAEKSINEEESNNAIVEESNSSLDSTIEDIDAFLGLFCNSVSCEEQPGEPPEIPTLTIDKFVEFVEKKIKKYESSSTKWSSDNYDHFLLAAVDKISKITSALSKFSSSHTNYNEVLNKTDNLLYNAMSFLEDEFYFMLDDPRTKQEAINTSNSKTKRPPSFARPHEPDKSVMTPAQEANSGESTPIYSTETMQRLHGIAETMIMASYDTECCQIFSIARRNVYEAGLTRLGFEKHSIDDILKMSWETLETEIVSWIKAFKHTISISFTNERELCDTVFAGHTVMADSLLNNFARGIVIQLLSLPDAVTMTKRSTEKLFKVLDMYEALRDVLPTMDTLFPNENERNQESPALTDLKSEILAVQCRLGEAAVSIFCEIETSVKSDAGKTPVHGGAIYPLTRYVMNYLKYACAYKNTLEQVFRKHKNTEKISSYEDDGEESRGQQYNAAASSCNDNPFAAQFIEILDLLHSNLERKSKLYKDQALCNIFLMNNGRYIMQKIRGSAEINYLLGDVWRRKRSSDLQQYHKNYQRETWAKVLMCLKDEGLMVKGNVQKPMLKERFKSFNSMFEDIHKTQSTWVVTDEQIKSELRISISAVVVPAYRSFLGKYAQHLTPGRQTEKYIKYGGDVLEGCIDELFDGNASNLASKRRN